MLAAGAQPAGRISAKAPSALGASLPFPPSRWEGGTCFPRGIPAVSCSCRCGDRARGRVPPLPAPCSCRRRVSPHAASRGMQRCRCQLPAGQGEAAATPAGNLERFPDLFPRELFVQSHLPALGTELGSGTELEGRGNGRRPSSLNIKPTSCPQLPVLLSSSQKDEKMGSLTLSGRGSSCGGGGGQYRESGGCVTKHPIYHLPPRPGTPGSRGSLSLFPALAWSMLKAGAEEIGLCVVSAALFSAGGSCSARLAALRLAGCWCLPCCAWVLGCFRMLCCEMLLTAPSARGCRGLSQPRLYKFEQRWF